MLSRTHRFHGYGSLDYTYRHGKVARRPEGLMRFTQNPKRSTYRIAVVVSKKVHKSAVVRNRIRRRVYESIRRHEVDIPSPYDIVFTIFDINVATMPVTELDKFVRIQLAALSAP